MEVKCRIGSEVAWVLLVAAVGGCGSERRATSEGVPPTVTDSAGIEIVVNRVPPAGLPVYATLDSTPELDLGAVPGDETSPLREVKAALTLSTGEVTVANAGTLEIRFYGADGTWLGWMGGQGFDEGEYWTLSGMGRAGGDTLWAVDRDRRRLTIFERNAGVVSTAEVPSGHSVAGRFGDGSFLLVPHWPLSLHRENPAEGVRRDPARYVRWWPDGGDTIGVGTFPHDQILVVESDEGLSLGVPPFGRQTVQAVGPGRFYVGDQEGFIIGGYDPDGTQRQSIRLEGIDLSLTPEQVAASRAEKGSNEGAAERAERFWATVPDTRPAYTRILLDAGGNLWVAEHVATVDPPRNWLVFDPSGACQGLVTVPRGFVLGEIGLRHLLGTVKGAGGGERVVRYKLTRSR